MNYFKPRSNQGPLFRIYGEYSHLLSNQFFQSRHLFLHLSAGSTAGCTKIDNHRLIVKFFQYFFKCLETHRCIDPFAARSPCLKSSIVSKWAVAPTIWAERIATENDGKHTPTCSTMPRKKPHCYRNGHEKSISNPLLLIGSGVKIKKKCDPWQTCSVPDELLLWTSGQKRGVGGTRYLSNQRLSLTRLFWGYISPIRQ